MKCETNAKLLNAVVRRTTACNRGHIGGAVSKVRGVRFTKEEELLIEEFLRKNQFLDFTTLSKIAILEFIKRPTITFTAVDQNKIKEASDARTI